MNSANDQLISNIQKAVDDSGAEMGLSALHLESGEEINIQADRPFPMCSVFKIPVLCEAFRQIHAGKHGLADRWSLSLAEKNLPSGVLVFLEDGLEPTLRDLLTLMIIISDNTATDMVMNRLGVKNINNYMHELGMTDIHVTMRVRDIFDDMLGEASDPRRAFTDLDQQRTLPASNRAGRAYSDGPDNDVSTPRAMTQLLRMIFEGQVVDRAACDAILHILLQQQINSRLPLFLPYGVPFAHKTGTLAGIRNDSGILYANDNSHVAITLFSRWDVDAVREKAKSDPAAEWQRTNEIDSTFGQIGRLFYMEYR